MRDRVWAQKMPIVDHSVSGKFDMWYKSSKELQVPVSYGARNFVSLFYS